MDFIPLADPFNIRFEKDGIQYEARVVYAKSASSCANFFNVEVIWPQGIEPFCLKEKPVHHEAQDQMVWIDAQGREKVYYQIMGEEIAGYLKSHLGIFLIDFPVADKNHQTEEF